MPGSLPTGRGPLSRWFNCARISGSRTSAHSPISSSAFTILPELSQLANGVGQFVFAPRRRFQFGSKFKDAWPKCVKPGVVPWTGGLARFWLFSQIDQIHSFVHENGSALADILVPFHGDDRVDSVRQIGDRAVITGIDQNIAVAENERASCRQNRGPDRPPAPCRPAPPEWRRSIRNPKQVPSPKYSRMASP